MKKMITITILSVLFVIQGIAQAETQRASISDDGMTISQGATLVFEKDGQRRIYDRMLLEYQGDGTFSLILEEKHRQTIEEAYSGHDGFWKMIGDGVNKILTRQALVVEFHQDPSEDQIRGHVDFRGNIYYIRLRHPQTWQVSWDNPENPLKVHVNKERWILTRIKPVKYHCDDPFIRMLIPKCRTQHQN